MAKEIDLSDPADLAALLSAALPGCVDDDAATCAVHLDTLRASRNPIFDGVGVGERVDPRPLRRAGAGADAPDEPDDALPSGAPVLATVAGTRVAKPRWTNRDRRRAKGKHPIYRLDARHIRDEPIRAGFTGRCQAVRVRLPRAKPDRDAFIGTWIGTVEAKDHLLFSVAEVEDRYAQEFGQRRALARVDLITGARFRGRRFSPVSIYLGYCSEDRDAKPDFYFLEGGSAQGKPEVLYCAASLDQGIHQEAGFKFTPLACKTNWYEGGLELSRSRREPACVYLSIAQQRDGRDHYLRLSVTYARQRRLRAVVAPFELQVEAALRVLAIAEQAGCELQRGQGGALDRTLGPMMRALMPWDVQPTGHPLASERQRFCGCPK